MSEWCLFDEWPSLATCSTRSLFGDILLGKRLATLAVAAQAGLKDNVVLGRGTLTALEEELALLESKVADVPARPLLVHLCAHGRPLGRSERASERGSNKAKEQEMEEEK